MKIRTHGRVVIENERIVEVTGFDVEFDPGEVSEDRPALVQLREYLQRRYEPKPAPTTLHEAAERIHDALYGMKPNPSTQHGRSV